MRLGQLERYGPAGLLLDDGGAKPDRVAEVNVGDAKSDKVAAPQLAVDRGSEHCEVVNAPLVLKAGPNGQMCFGLSGGFGPMIRP